MSASSRSTTSSSAAPAAAAAPASSAASPLRFIMALGAGTCFGAAFQLSRVHELHFVQRQMVFQTFVMLKMFLAAAATSTLMLNVALPALGYGDRVTFWSTVMRRNLNRGILATTVGAGMVGVGMALTGSCPGTVFGQLGAGSIVARYTVVGGLLGAFIYAYVDSLPFWNTKVVPYGIKEWQKKGLEDVVGGKKSSLAIKFASMLGALVLVLEFAVPWSSDLATLKSSPQYTRFPFAIPPSVAGLIVGSLQLPLIIFVDNHLGTASSYIALLANSFSFCCSLPLFSALKSYIWQCWMMAGVALGAYATSQWSGETFRSDHLVSPTQALVGGVVFGFGARLAAGCTSGHGLSGMGHLSLNSFLAVASMFGAGILTTLLFLA